jgi:hypothetical protein
MTERRIAVLRANAKVRLQRFNRLQAVPAKTAVSDRITS